MPTNNQGVQRHCMVVHNYYPFAETRVQRQADALVSRGIAVDVIGLKLKDEPATDTVDGINVYRLPIQRHKGKGIVMQFVEYLFFFVLAFFKLSTLYFQKRYDVIQIHNLPDYLVFTALIPKLMGSKVVLDLHDLMPEFYIARFGGDLSSTPAKLLSWQEQLSCRFADHVITVTEPWRQTLIERGVSANKCSVVMNLADGRFFGAVTESAKRNGRFQLIYHGTLAHRYGIDLLLRAFALVHQEIPMTLLIHGRGEYLDDLLSLANELKLENCVDFSTQFLPTAKLSELITAADVGIIPYRRDIFTDGILPTKLMEYTALGLPTIVARTPGISAYFDETMVEFFTPGNVEQLAGCIQSLYHHQSRLDELNKNCQRFNQQYNWEIEKGKYTGLIEELASN